MRDIERTFPSDSSVCRPVKLPEAARGGGTPRLVLEAVSGAVCLIDRKPLLIAALAAALGRQAHPGLAAVRRAPYVYAKSSKETEIEEVSCFIRVQYGIAPEDIIFQNPGKRPVSAAISTESPAPLPKV